jgi:hypothetical protein
LKEAKDKKKVMVGAFHLTSLLCKCFGIIIAIYKFCACLTPPELPNPIFA